MVIGLFSVIWIRDMTEPEEVAKEEERIRKALGDWIQTVKAGLSAIYWLIVKHID